MKTVEQGDRVQYKAEFLRNIGVYTGDMPQAKGTVTEIQQSNLRSSGDALAFAIIDWGDPNIPPKVNVNNLKRVADWEPN